MITTGIKLEPDTMGRLKSLGELRERSPHWLMKKAIQEYLDREEACEREKKEDLARWERYASTGEYLTQEELRNRLGHPTK